MSRVWLLHHRRRQPDPVRFVYLTGAPSRVTEVQRLAGGACHLIASSCTLQDALVEAERASARVLLVDYAIPGIVYRDIVNACRDAAHPLAVVVILDSFDGHTWLELICTRVYDIVLRTALRESLGRMLCGAHAWACSGAMPARARI